MMGMKQEVLAMHGYDDWTVTPTGILCCPHGYLCEDDQRQGLGECGCVSPLVELGMI